VSRGSILLVEDDHHLGRSIRDYLAAKGFAVTWVQDGLSAIRAVHEAPVDLVVLDIFLPERDGISVCAVLREGLQPPKVIAMSATDVSAKIDATLPPEKRPEVFRVKPIPLRELLATVEELLQENQVARPTPIRQSSRKSIAPKLLELHRIEASGTLTIRGYGIETQLYFLKGRPIWGEGGPRSTTLGSVLLSLGVIAEAEYAQALDRQIAWIESAKRVSLGEVLMQMGLLSPPDYVEALESQVRAKVRCCFSWDRFDLEFEEGTAFLDDKVVLEGLSCEAMILDGVRWFWDGERIDQELATVREQYPALKNAPEDLELWLEMRPAERLFLDTITGDRSIEELCYGSSSLDRATRCSVMVALLETERAELHSAPKRMMPPQPTDQRRAAASTEPSMRGEIIAENLRLKGKPDHEVLGLSPSPEPDDVLAAFELRARRFSPDYLPDDLDADLRYRVMEVYAQMCEARDRLVDGRGTQLDPINVREQVAALEAERAVVRGLSYLRHNDARNTLDQLSQAVAKAPDNLEYQMHRAWATYHWADTGVEVLEARKAVQKLARGVLRQDYMVTDARLILAQCALATGDTEGATEEVRVAQRFAPGDARVAQILEQLER